MIKFNINAQTELAKEAFVAFINDYRETLSQQLNVWIQNQSGDYSDASIEVIDGELHVFQFATDKGFVIGETKNKSLPVEIMEYKDLEEGSKYLIQETDKYVLFLKRGLKEADVRLGAFRTLSDSIMNFNSEAVEATIKRWKDMEKAKQKENKRKEKLGKTVKLPAQEAQEVEAEQVEDVNG